MSETAPPQRGVPPTGTGDEQRSAAELGLMQGTPPPDDKLITFRDWQRFPNRRWSFQHVDRFVGTARVWRGSGTVSRLEPGPVDLDAVSYVTQAGGAETLPALLRRTCTDGFLVLHRGRVVTERYCNGMQPHSRHLLMSVSKSLTGTLAGAVIGRGLVAPGDLVVDILTELRGTSFEGATVRHLLDMRTGTRFVEDYEDPECDAADTDWIADWGPPPPGVESPGLYAYIPTLPNAGEHGGPFDYRSILTDVLGWVLERASGLQMPQLASEYLWAPLGAEEDAEITVDRRGGPWVDGGFCTTLRDLARVGQVYAQGGAFNGRQIVPPPWVEDTCAGDADSREAFAGSAWGERYPHGIYRNQWWVLRPQDRVFTGSGIYGQFLYVDVPAQVVVAKVSTLPVAVDEDLWLDHMALFDAVVAAL
jgi:CubicO group peptidase (beta-lactamase class C family)